MDRKGMLVPIALGLVPAVVIMFVVQNAIARLSGPDTITPVTLSTPTPYVTPTPSHTPTVTPTSVPPYVPVPTVVAAVPAAIGRMPDTPTAIPSPTITPTTTVVTATATTTPTATATAQPANTATATATPSPTVTPILFEFIVVGREEQCDSTSPADYSGDLVTGRVVDLNGRGLSGIRVKIASIHTISPWSAESTTDSNGNFRFHLSKGNFEVWVASGSSAVASELWTRSTAEAGVCRWSVTFKKTR